MKFIHTFLVILFIIGDIGCNYCNAQQIYISSQKGNDKWSGILSNPNKTGTDGPIASIKRAIELIEEIKKQEGKDTIFVNLAAGVYLLNNMLVFERGSGIGEDKYVVFRSMGNSKAIISGAKKITINVALPGQINKTSLPEAANGKLFFEQLYQDDHALPRAKEPNKGFFYMSNVEEDTLQRTGYPKATAWLSKYYVSNNQITTVDYNKLKQLSAPELQDILITIPFKWNMVKRYVDRLDDRKKKSSNSKGAWHG